MDAKRRKDAVAAFLRGGDNDSVDGDEMTTMLSDCPIGPCHCEGCCEDESVFSPTGEMVNGSGCGRGEVGKPARVDSRVDGVAMDRDAFVEEVEGSDDVVILFDCGEGTANQLRRLYPSSFLRLLRRLDVRYCVAAG